MPCHPSCLGVVYDLRPTAPAILVQASMYLGIARAGTIALIGLASIAFIWLGFESLDGQVGGQCEHLISLAGRSRLTDYSFTTVSNTAYAVHGAPRRFNVYDSAADRFKVPVDGGEPHFLPDWPPVIQERTATSVQDYLGTVDNTIGNIKRQTSRCVIEGATETQLATDGWYAGDQPFRPIDPGARGSHSTSVNGQPVTVLPAHLFEWNTTKAILQGPIGGLAKGLLATIGLITILCFAALAYAQLTRRPRME